MTSLLNYLLSFVLIYGYPVIAAVVLVGDLGIPLPVTSVLLTAGSLTVDGTLNMIILIPMVTIIVVIGDVIGYYIGKRYRDWETDRKSTRLNSSHSGESRMPSSA